MCGIAGEVRLDDRAADRDAVAAMVAAQVARGPDGEGSVADGRVALGHRRLKVIDLTDASSQPFTDPDTGLRIVFNGCVYNYEALRDDLRAKGHTFRSGGDTEVLLKAYAEWGEACVERLTGMFAFAVVEPSGRVVLARDRLGIKPLYLAEAPGRLRFASTLPALLAAGDVDTSIDDVALAHYLSFHAVVGAPRTILTGVRKLPPATTLVIEPDGRRRERRFWAPAFTRRDEHAGWSPRDWRDAIRDSLRTAVRRRLVADVEVGVLLSGGLDSSLVVALLAEQGQTDLATFSVGFEDVGQTKGDEFAYSDLVAERFGTRHTKIRVPSGELLGALDDAVLAMPEPMVSHDVVAFHLLSREVSRSIRVVQSGQGADEVFAGYHWYPPMATAPGLGHEVYGRAFRDADLAGLHALLAPEHRIDRDVAGELIEAAFAESGADTPTDRALRLDTTVMLVEDPVKRVDAMTMAFGLEARVPFLDHDLVELAAACPPGLKTAQGGKGILKDAARGIVPDAVIDRPKGYFPVPALTHLRGEFGDRVRDVLSQPAAKDRGLFAPGEVDRLLALADAGSAELTPLRGNRLWQLSLLEWWLQAQDV